MLSIKKPRKPERMERPEDAFSYNPDDTSDLNLMRRFNIKPEVFEVMGEKARDALRRGYKRILEGEK